MTETTYAGAGVNLETSERVKSSIKEIVRPTHSKNVLKGIGLFSGFYALEKSGFEEPVLVSSMDGVGTKVKIAEMMGLYDTIGEDLVNHCVNDIMVSGADPLFFLDYIAADKLDSEVVTGIITGLSRGCQAAGCALLGGETAEMPDVYLTDNFDLAGCIVGVVDRAKIIDGSLIQRGDAVVGVQSNGLHTNGYSLVRQVLFEQRNHGIRSYCQEFESELGAELLRTHRSYAKLIRSARNLTALHGIAHITGGGIAANTRRLLREGLWLEVDWRSWNWPAIFTFLQSEGTIADEEMRKVFNLGIGLTLIVAKSSVDELLALCHSVGEQAHVIGEIVEN